ncbi:hypothetical protein, partial [Vibrio sp.]|uniref:hypothetical protein n=1 Tax=Vibrio sp. TaxID=678 RepID=UPI0037B06BE1
NNGIISHAVYLSVNRSGENTSTDYTATPSSFHTPEIIIALDSMNRAKKTIYSSQNHPLLLLIGII